MSLEQAQPQPQPQLRQAIDEAQDRLRASVPSDHLMAILALVDVLDDLPTHPAVDSPPDLVTGRRRHPADLGRNKALHLCLESTRADTAATPPRSEAELGRWAEGFLAGCGQLAEAEIVLAHCETGFMRVVDEGNGTFNAWIATKRVPTSWRERADVDWWASWLAERYAPALGKLDQGHPEAEPHARGAETRYHRAAQIHLEMMAYQLGYPPDAIIDGCTVQTYRDVLQRLIERALRQRQARDCQQVPRPESERSLVAELAADLLVDPAIIDRAVDAFTLDRERAAYHAAVPGVAAAPLIRIDSDLLVFSLHGLLTEPLLYLTRELKRRAPQDYHNSAYLREDVFRQDLYALFQDKRFVTSHGRIVLRRERGDVRTDVDAVVFDRKTGALGLFELKTQDPFARSTAELARQRDNVLYANRQISGVLAWLQRYGADELLNRASSRTAKGFRVQKVYPFVLGRYLAHFNDGPAPDRRAAWGTWPDVLRLVNDRQPRPPEANPLASLFNRLTKNTTLVRPPTDLPAREITFGHTRLVVYPSYAAFRASAET
jgi:hypothetical protein